MDFSDIIKYNSFEIRKLMKTLVTEYNYDNYNRYKFDYFKFLN